MPPPTPLSPPELSYLYTSLALSPPIRPDLRTSFQFRPIVAECSFLPHCNGSSRICMAEAGECIVGVKAEVEKDATSKYATVIERDKWIEVSVEVAGGGASGPGSGVGVGGISGAGGAAGKDEGDGGAAVWLKEGLLAGGAGILDRLVISKGWHWKLYIDVLLLTPTSHPPPLLLSAATNMALDSTFLPKLISPHDVDDIPAFSDDWGISVPLYEPSTFPRPPMSLPVIAVGDNVFLDPSVAEIAAAEVGLVVTLTLADAEGHCDIVGVRGMEVGRGGGKEGERKGISRKLLRQMVGACVREAGDVIKGLGESTRQQMFRA
ncbi:hypothetical protein Dda_4538 [Drechslerella dactyloides]|uniref:Ribosomal RNA-processing protein 42 n=1 Tax=Drechslerella dactyloides TaxID=74499 RepID=A0AAD6IX43_DREDA|nr:hypothetical protein Dda_4538 [Drechslerella dactyloides]